MQFTNFTIHRLVYLCYDTLTVETLNKNGVQLN